MLPGNAPKSRLRLLYLRNFHPLNFPPTPQAGWKPSDNLPVVLGTTSGEMSLGEKFLQQAISQPTHHRRQATRIVHYQVQQQGLNLGSAFGFQGPLTTIS